MIRRLGLPLAFLALFVVAGGHWAVLQSVAWAKMIVEYSQKAGLEEGVIKTFDGKHLCPLCLKVAHAQKQEDRVPATVDAKKKTDSFVSTILDRLLNPAGISFSWPHDGICDGIGRADQPPVPPPPSRLS